MMQGMTTDKIVNLFAGIVTLAGVWVIFTSPKTASILRAGGGVFSGALKAATGR